MLLVLEWLGAEADADQEGAQDGSGVGIGVGILSRLPSLTVSVGGSLSDSATVGRLLRCLL